MFTFLPNLMLQIRHDHVVLGSGQHGLILPPSISAGSGDLRRGYPRFPLTETAYSRMTYGPWDAKDLNFVIH
jgi:hypothetical protein